MPARLHQYRVRRPAGKRRQSSHGVGVARANPSIYTPPASQTSWWPQLALLNGERASLRQEDEGLELALLPGRQSLVLQGNLAGRNSLPLAFGLNINNLYN